VNVCEAIVIVPVRGDVVGFAVTENETTPLPVALAPFVTVIHASLLVASHAQPESVVTEAVPVPPPEATDWLVGATE
jgi:hypothetical protein